MLSEKEKKALIEEIRREVSAESPEKVDEVELKTVEKRLDGLKEAVQRNRSVFVVMIIACSAVLFTIWNSNFSRERTLAFNKEGMTANKKAPGSDEENARQEKEEAESMSNFGLKTLVGEWYKSRSIQVNLLGIKIDVGDLSLIGSFSLVVLTIWYFYSQRQVNRLIRDLTQDAIGGSHKYSEKIKCLIFHGIIQNAMFAKYEPASINSRNPAELAAGPLSGNSKPESGPPAWSWFQTGMLFGLIVITVPVFIFVPLIIYLSLLDSLHLVGAIIAAIVIPLAGIFLFRKKIRDLTEFLGEKCLTESDKADKTLITSYTIEEKSFSDRVVNFLFYIPFWTMVTIIARDILNLCMVSPLRGSASPELAQASVSLANYLMPSLNKYGVPIGLDILLHAYNDHRPHGLFLATLFDSFAIVCAFYIYILCKESTKFTNENIIRIAQLDPK